MLEKINSVKADFLSEVEKVKDMSSLEDLRLKFLVKKGSISVLLEELKDVPKEQKPIIGKELNLLNKLAENTYAELKSKFSTRGSEKHIDITLQGRTQHSGNLHPVRQIFNEMIDVFNFMGFEVAEGPQIEEEFYNFDALNFQPDHPARDMQDTFFIKSNRTENKLVLRTHTSPIQIRIMRIQTPPIRCIMPGRVYRNEAISARSLAEFHQIEGLYIDKQVSFSELKATLQVFARKMYGNDSDFRFRPSFFPFTEPSAELDISCFLCKGTGCKICKGTGWLEIAGAGMVHPNVLRMSGVDPGVYSGYAFGMGTDRITSFLHGITTPRHYFENDIQFLSQF
jgi:phenylalanyl-tRNA synthetase alpha chain